MVFPIRIPCTIARLSLLPLALLIFASERQISAQTAPTLLPYTSKLIAGGGTAVIGTGQTCPSSGFKSVDPYGDGCLATEVDLGNNNYTTGGKTPGARAAVADKNGNVFFTDFTNGLIRRVDAATGIVTAVAGGATANPASGAVCDATTTATATDALGDGCPGTDVKLVSPASLAFAPNGDLYFGDVGKNEGNIRKIAATGGLITTTGTISLVLGNPTGASGYFASNTTTTITQATSYLDAPYGIAFDNQGDLFVTDEFYAAVLVYNTNTTGSNTVNNTVVPAGQVWKVAGTLTTGGPYCLNGTASTAGCTFNKLYVEGTQANSNFLRSAYGIALDQNGNLFIANEFYDSIPVVAPSGVLTTYAGIGNTAAKVLKRGQAGSFAIGSSFGVATDTNGDLYINDASSGVIWRVDAPGKQMYVVAGGGTATLSAGSPCSSGSGTAVDSNGDGCPAIQATFGSSSGSTNFASATLPGPGIFGVSVDPFSDLVTADTETNLVREVATGAFFGAIGANQPTQNVAIHFAAGDTPAANAYKLLTGQTNFTLGTATCAAPNSDNTVDCMLPVTATPTVLGQFSGTLQVTSTSGGVSVFPLGGIYVQTPFTRISVTIATTGTACSGGTGAISTGTPQIITATISATASPTGASPTGTITFYGNGNQLGTPQPVANNKASLTYTFSSPGTYTVTATYSGDSYFKVSTGTAPTTVITSNPTFAVASTGYQEPSVVAGGTALYSFALNQSVYTGTITFACQGLPAYASCVFSPPSITATGCSTSNTVAVSIYTQQATSVNPTSLAGRGRWMPVSLLFGIGLSIVFAFRRRRFASRLGGVGLMLAMLIAAMGTSGCGKGAQTLSTPLGTYTINITATGTAGTVATLPVTLKVN